MFPAAKEMIDPNPLIAVEEPRGLSARNVLAARVEHHFNGFINTVHKGLSNSRLEGINAKIRLINARAYGHHSVDALMNAIYLNLGGIDISPVILILILWFVRDLMFEYLV